MRLEELALVRYASSDLAIRVSRESFGTPIPALLKKADHVNPFEFELAACINHVLGRKDFDMPPPLKVQFMLDFIENKIDVLSVEALLQVPREVEGYGEGEEEG